MPDNTDRLLTVAEVSELTGWRRQHIARLEKAGDFPRRIKTGSNTVRWSHSEIMHWLETKKLQRREPPAEIDRTPPLTPPPIGTSVRDFWSAYIEAAKRTKETADLDPGLEWRQLSALVNILERYASPLNWEQGKAIALPPPEMVFRLVHLLRRLLNGDPVPSLEAARPKTRHRSLDAQMALEEIGVYCNAVRKYPDLVADVDPIETVRVAYGMNSREQVRKVLAELHPARTDPDRFIPDNEAYVDQTEWHALVREIFRARITAAARAWRHSKTIVARNAAVPVPIGTKSHLH